MLTLKFPAHVSMLINNPGGKQGVFSHEIRETHKTMKSLLDQWPFFDAGSVCTWYKQNQYRTSQSIHHLKTPNFLTVTDMNMSCYHQVIVAVVSKGLYSPFTPYDSAAPK